MSDRTKEYFGTPHDWEKLDSIDGVPLRVPAWKCTGCGYEIFGAKIPDPKIRVELIEWKDDNGQGPAPVFWATCDEFIIRDVLKL